FPDDPYSLCLLCRKSNRLDPANLTYFQYMAGAFSEYMVNGFPVLFHKTVFYTYLYRTCDSSSVLTAYSMFLNDTFTNSQSNRHGLILFVPVDINILEIFKRRVS